MVANSKNSEIDPSPKQSTPPQNKQSDLNNVSFQDDPNFAIRTEVFQELKSRCNTHGSRIALIDSNTQRYAFQMAEIAESLYADQMEIEYFNLLQNMAIDI